MGSSADSTKDTTKQRNGSRPTFAYEGPRYMVQLRVSYDPRLGFLGNIKNAMLWEVWDRELRQPVGEPLENFGLAEKRARELNEADS